MADGRALCDKGAAPLTALTLSVDPTAGPSPVDPAAASVRGCSALKKTAQSSNLHHCFTLYLGDLDMDCENLTGHAP